MIAKEIKEFKKETFAVCSICDKCDSCNLPAASIFEVIIKNMLQSVLKTISNPKEITEEKTFQALEMISIMGSLTKNREDFLSDLTKIEALSSRIADAITPLEGSKSNKSLELDVCLSETIMDLASCPLFGEESAQALANDSQELKDEILKSH